MFNSRVLVVDDERRIRLTLTVALEACGVEVETVAGGQHALDCLEHRAYDLLLVDLSMPGMNGLEVLRRARIVRPGQLVVLMTAYASGEVLDAAKHLGAAAVLAKPFSPTELRRILRQYLGPAACDWPSETFIHESSSR